MHEHTEDMDGEDDEDPGGEYSLSLDYLVVTATNFLSSLLRSDDHVKVPLLDRLALSGIR